MSRSAAPVLVTLSCWACAGPASEPPPARSGSANAPRLPSDGLATGGTSAGGGTVAPRVTPSSGMQSQAGNDAGSGGSGAAATLLAGAAGSSDAEEAPVAAGTGGQLEPARPSGTIETALGNGRVNDNGSSGSAFEINVGQPFGVELGPGGELYVTEIQNHRVLKLNVATERVELVAGNGEQGYSGDGGPATQAALNEPYEVRLDAQGNTYIVEMKNHIVRRIDIGGVIRTIAGTGSSGYSGDGGPATAAKLSSPHGIALDSAGALYIADIGNHRIRKVDLTSGEIETIAGTGARTAPADGQWASGNPIVGPRAIYFHQDVLWIALREGHSVWKLAIADGTLHHVAGDGIRGFSGDGGSAKAARFDGPKGIAVGPQGHVFVVDTENQRIRKIDPVADRIETIAGTGQQGGAGDGGPATRAQLDRPHGIAVAADGTIYIGDTNNHQVRRVSP